MGIWRNSGRVSFLSSTWRNFRLTQLILRRDDLAETFDMNVVSVHNVTRAFLPILAKGETKKVFNM
jgi:NAD(P)-dependent dehydrogenase (short-subunit alcohol dehydrogenase family)